MANIIGSISKMNDVEIASDQPLSQSLMLKFGANINALIDRGARNVTFQVSGIWNCPADVTQVTLYGAGGGGGGGNGYQSSNGNGFAGGGGAGAVPALVSVPVTPNTAYTITIGTGGAGAPRNGDGSIALNPLNGSSGGNTTMTTGSKTLATFYGGRGGFPYTNNNANGGAFSYGLFAAGGSFNTDGQPTQTALGGVAGSRSGSTGSAGGGGGAGIGVGGAGGAGTRYSEALPGLNAPGLSAGGGGGGTSYEDRGTPNYSTTAAGGAGGSGFLMISY